MQVCDVSTLFHYCITRANCKLVDKGVCWVFLSYHYCILLLIASTSNEYLHREGQYEHCLMQASFMFKCALLFNVTLLFSSLVTFSASPVQSFCDYVTTVLYLTVVCPTLSCIANVQLSHTICLHLDLRHYCYTLYLLRK